MTVVIKKTACLMICLGLLFSLSCKENEYHFDSTSITDAKCAELFPDNMTEISAVSQNNYKSYSFGIVPVNMGVFEIDSDEASPEGIYFTPTDGERVCILEGPFINLQLCNEYLYAVAYQDFNAPLPVLCRVNLEKIPWSNFPTIWSIIMFFPTARFCMRII